MPSKNRKRKLTAYHEAGHAVAAYLLKAHRIKSLSIIPEGETEGLMRHSAPGDTYRPDYQRTSRTRSKTEKLIMVCLAGDAAENLFLKKDSRNIRLFDYSKAVDLAAYHCADPDETGAYVNFLYYRVRNLLRIPENWTKIEVLAAALIQKEFMNGEATYSLLRK